MTVEMVVKISHTLSYPVLSEQLLLCEKPQFFAKLTYHLYCYKIGCHKTQCLLKCFLMFTGEFSICMHTLGISGNGVVGGEVR